MDGTAAQFANCYGPTWGRHKPRTRPTTGNHDYHQAGAAGYFDYFNGVGNQTGPAGDRAGGYYSYNLGNWHIVVLNSECTSDGVSSWDNNGCAVGSPQETWLRADLAASPTNNIIAMWHRPLYSSTSSASTHAFEQPLWQALYDYGVDIWLGGHWHNYERLAPMDASGNADPNFGIRSFVVGTGGASFTGFGTILPTSEARNSSTYGVLKLTLHDTSYDWEFIPIVGQSFTDSGTRGARAAVGQHGADRGCGLRSDGRDRGELERTVTDDGVPGPYTVTWSKVSGPGTVAFGDTHRRPPLPASARRACTSCS